MNTQDSLQVTAEVLRRIASTIEDGAVDPTDEGVQITLLVVRQTHRLVLALQEAARTDPASYEGLAVPTPTGAITEVQPSGN